MRVRTLMHDGSILWLGLRQRCPVCTLGHLFERRLHMHATCPYCGVRFERSSGESLGGVYINAFLTLVLALTGFVTTEALFHPPVVLQIAVWMGFALAFPLAFYRPARGLWVAITYLTGGVYADPDYEREYVRTAVQRRNTQSAKGAPKSWR